MESQKEGTPDAVTPKEVLYAYALSLLGQPYRWGGDDPIEGFDCSGLAVELLKAAGVFEGSDAGAANLYILYSGLPVSPPCLGTLCFFGANGTVTHVGFCLNSTQMIEAGGGGSKTLTREDAARQNAYVRIRPIKSRKDFIGFRTPVYPWL